jgi:Icc protein
MGQDPLRIVQITDTHIVAEPGGKVFGVDSFVALRSLLAIAQGEPSRQHLLVATGDLSEDGTPASYQRLRSLLAPLLLPVYCVPGNHDSYSEMQAHLRNEQIRMERRVVRVGWQIIFLDSQVPDHEHGLLNSEDFIALENALQEMPDHHALVCLHHGPLRVCPTRPCRLENAEEFLGVLHRYSNVRGVISGHNHCAVDEQHGGIRIMVTPSSVAQLTHPSQALSGDATHALDRGLHGFRRLELHPDGQIETEVVWSQD